MKRALVLIGAGFSLAAVSVAIGLWLGFRQGWGLGVAVDAAPRGAIAIGEVRLLDSGRSDDLRFKFESDVDVGLMWWHDVDQSRLRPVLNVLAGANVIPQYEVYVRRLAAYRKRHPSPEDDPGFIQRMLDGMAAEGADPAVVREVTEGLTIKRHIVQEMVRKYGE